MILRFLRGVPLLLLPAGLLAAEPFKLADPGTERIVDYSKYGKFEGVGTYGYKYVITDSKGLAAASGEGVDPNRSLWSDPEFKAYRDNRKIAGPVWKFVRSGDPQADFYAWAGSSEDPGLRLLFTGKALEEGGHYHQALKAYYASMILYPKSFCWSSKRTYTWMVAPSAWGSIVTLERKHPEVGLKLSGALVKTRGNIGGDPAKNEAAITPGRFVPWSRADRDKSRVDASKLKVTERRGGKVACVRYENGQWGFEVDGKPFLIKGVSYLPTKVGFHIKDWSWLKADENKNGKNDPGEDSWADKNRNGVQDADEPAVGDFRLLQEMGCNAIRVFTNEPLDLELLRRMHKEHGIYVILNDPFGAYTVHSGAAWEKGTDYRDPQQRKNMLEAVRKTVEQCKDEPWLLMYVLGNENNMPPSFSGVNATRTNAGIHPEDYASLLQEAAEMIHKLDPNHPVGVGNQGLNLLDVYAEKAPGLDVLGINEYAGSDGFGAMWEAARAIFDRPVLVMEYGCDAYWTGKGPNEQMQADYHRGNWEDLMFNRAGEPGAGNAIGGVVFEWVDEWWKDTSVKEQDGKHNSEPTIEMAFPDGWSQEEWLGITGQGDGKQSPFLRELRKAYDVYKELWKAN